MEDLAFFREKVEQEIRSILRPPSTPLFGLDTMIAYHLGFSDREGHLCEEAKGKYLRPLFCVAVCAGLGGDPDKAVPAAASLEIGHRTSLVFDDIQDQGKDRNGQPAVWTIWGASQAINAGLALSSYGRLAAQRSFQRGVSLETTLRILSVLENAVIDLCWGQYYDLSFMETVSVSIEEYLRMIRGKTGSLFAAAAEAGALCAGVDENRVKLAREFGINMGIAFQIHDDYLGIWGNEATVGKTANDLTEKKRSLPVVMALREYPTQMKRWLDLREITPQEAGTIKFWMENRDIPKKVRTVARTYELFARENLNALHLSPDWEEHLNRSLDFAVNRKM